MIYYEPEHGRPGKCPTCKRPFAQHSPYSDEGREEILAHWSGERPLCVCAFRVLCEMIADDAKEEAGEGDGLGYEEPDSAKEARAHPKRLEDGEGDEGR